MSETSIPSLLRGGRIEEVEADVDAARSKLQESSRHLASAARITGSDPDGAYSLLYDAARKAIDAHMLANGYRTKAGRPGAHEATCLYAAAVLGSGEHADDIANLDRMRRTRNKSEYLIWEIGASTLSQDLEHARGIVEAVREDLGESR